MLKKVRLVIVAGALSTVAFAAKPPGGGTPPGRIHYQWREASYSMLADGTGKTAVQAGMPSKVLHGGRRWFLGMADASGTEPWSFPDRCPGNPNALPREMFASDGSTTVQLTGASSVQVMRNVRWAKDDSFASFSGLRWTPAPAGFGNFTDNAGQPWTVEAFVFRVSLTWTASGPVPGAAEALIPGFVDFGVSGGACKPDVDGLVHDWSVGGTQVAHDRASTSQLFVTAVATPDAPRVLTSPAANPAWSPDNARIAYDTTGSYGVNTGIWTIRPTGTDARQLTRPTRKHKHQYPYWSPDSLHVAYTERWHGATLMPGFQDVYRVSAAAGTPVNLTSDLPDEDPAPGTVDWATP